jgi:RNA polymerase sigma factor (sigma-70 family)
MGAPLAFSSLAKRIHQMRERKETSVRAVDVGRSADAALASRKRAAVALIQSHERALRRTARRFSLCADDAEDALQRALEILLTKAPTSDGRQLIRWMQTVTKHEALAVRRNRERHLGTPARSGADEGSDWVQLIPAEGDGPADAAERRERIARTREALKALKPQEQRALTLLAQGYSYAEIGEITGWTYTKVNRCLAEGRQRFRAILGTIEDGRRCDELAGALSAFVDGEANPALAAQMADHLRACSYCRAKVRAYRAAPRAAAALAPTLPVARSLSGRVHDLVGAVQSRLPGRTGAAEAAVTQIAATGGTRGGGTVLAAKILTACVGTAGGAAACVAAGVVPPVHLGGKSGAVPRIERTADKSHASDAARVAENPVPHPAPEPAPATPAISEATAPSPPPSQPTATPQVASEFSPEVATAPTVPRTSAAPAPGSGGPSVGSTSSGGGRGTGGGSGAEFGP